ncbi:Os11g0530650, partial [Oryza sativa Japonica Group]
HLVEDEEHAGARHVAVLGQHVARRPHPLLVQPNLRLHLVQDRRTSGVRHPEDGVPVRDPQRCERVAQRALDVLRDEPRHVLEQVERQPDLPQVAVDGALAVREDGLARRHHLEQRPLDGLVGVGADDHRRRAVAEQRLPDHGVEVGLGGPPERHRRDLGAHGEDARAAVVLGEVLGDAEHRAAGEAPLLVHHEAVHVGPQAEHLGELVVGAGHVDAGGGAEDEVGDAGARLPPLLDRLLRRRLPQLGDLDDDDVLPRVQRRRHVRAHVGVLLQDLLRQVHVPLPDLRLVT